VIAALFDRALYVEPDVQSIKDAEERERREMLAQSCVVSRARVCHAEFWRAVDARRSASPSGRLRLVSPGRNAAQG
jgi:predicted RNA-binding protein YlxR (DUF448 family)